MLAPGCFAGPDRPRPCPLPLGQVELLDPQRHGRAVDPTALGTAPVDPAAQNPGPAEPDDRELDEDPHALGLRPPKPSPRGSCPSSGMSTTPSSESAARRPTRSSSPERSSKPRRYRPGPVTGFTPSTTASASTRQRRGPRRAAIRGAEWSVGAGPGRQGSRRSARGPPRGRRGRRARFDGPARQPTWHKRLGVLAAVRARLEALGEDATEERPLADLSVEEPRAAYEAEVGRGTSNVHRGYLGWNIREARKGKVTVGEVQRGGGERCAEYNVLAVRMKLASRRRCTWLGGSGGS